MSNKAAAALVEAIKQRQEAERKSTPLLSQPQEFVFAKVMGVSQTESGKPHTGEKDQGVSTQKSGVNNERSNVRTYERTNERSNVQKLKRVVRRESFDIYEDQMLNLKAIQLESARDGQKTTLGEMAREAIDDWLEKQRGKR
jgi:hypothetical protein